MPSCSLFSSCWLVGFPKRSDLSSREAKGSSQQSCYFRCQFRIHTRPRSAGWRRVTSNSLKGLLLLTSKYCLSHSIHFFFFSFLCMKRAPCHACTSLCLVYNEHEARVVGPIISFLLNQFILTVLIILLFVLFLFWYPFEYSYLLQGEAYIYIWMFCRNMTIFFPYFYYYYFYHIFAHFYCLSCFSFLSRHSF